MLEEPSYNDTVFKLLDIAETLAHPDISCIETLRQKRPKAYMSHWYDQLENPTLGLIGWLDNEHGNPSESYKGILAARFILFDKSIHTCRVDIAEKFDALPASHENQERQIFLDYFTGYLAVNAESLPRYGRQRILTKVRQLGKVVEIRPDDHPNTAIL